MVARSYRDLLVWQKGIDLVEAVYSATGCWPRKEQYGLADQAQRAAVSVPSNIAEEQGRDSQKAFLNHLSIANGSLFEVETHLVIARRIGYIDEATATALLEQAAEVGRLLHGLMRSVRSTIRLPH